MKDFSMTPSNDAGRPVNSSVKRPNRIEVYIGIQGSVLAIVGTFFPWDASLARTLEWTLGIDLPAGWLTIICGAIAVILFSLRREKTFLGGIIIGFFVLILSGSLLVREVIDNMTAVGVCLSFVGGIMIMVGGFVGAIRSLKTERFVNV
jgi:hypothetical protein